MIKMSDLEIKSTLEDIINIFNELDISEEVKEHALSRFEDIMNHIQAHHWAYQAEIDCLKIRIEKLETKIRK
jgi:polyhydroxyalkanoate synthesis regulator phasin